MATIFGQELSRADLMRRVGDISQVARIVDYRFESGRAEGMRSYEVTTGSGLAFAVVPSRCMDIAWASYKGIPLSFISKSGVGAPSYFEKDGLGFLRNFTCGLMTTCGLTYMGAPCVDGGVELGLHGRISNIAAQNCSALTEWIGDDYILTMCGQVRESSLFGENMVINREISTKLGSNEIRICDRVVNEGFESTPFMLLYHCNFGYPLIDEGTSLCIDSPSVTPRDSRAAEGLSKWNTFHAPEHGFTEQLYYFDAQSDTEGYAQAVVENSSLLQAGLRVVLRFQKDTLPYCSEWKQLGEGDYVVGIEPGTWLPEGRAKARERGELKMLEPGEEYRTELLFSIQEM